MSIIQFKTIFPTYPPLLQLIYIKYYRYTGGRVFTNKGIEIATNKIVLNNNENNNDILKALT